MILAMSEDWIATIRGIERETDLLVRALRLAAGVSGLFAEAGWPLIVVGGAAVEFYTEGGYMSGDIDLCRTRAAPIPLRLSQDLMGRLGATGGPRSWRVAGLFVDVLGLIENEARTPCRRIATVDGDVTVMPPELAVVERTLLAFYPEPNREARDVAKKLLAVCIRGDTPVDWDEISRLASLPSFDVACEMEALKKEVADELEASA